MHILMTGGTGFIGQHLHKHLHKHDKITVLSRLPTRAYHLLGNDIELIDDLALLEDLNSFDAIINLAGEPIADKRWTEQQKQRICQSRWQLTQQLSHLIQQSTKPPSIFISGSAIGYYGKQNEQAIDESFDKITPGFTHTVCEKWERLAMQAAGPLTRVCILRTGIVLGKEGGALQKMLPAYKFGFGGPLGNGKQYLSWIHISDMIKAIIYLLENSKSHGIYNLTAPKPVTNNEFSLCLARSLKRPHLARIPAWLLKLMLGESSSLLLEGQNALPKHLLDDGFKFCYPELTEALQALTH